MTPTAFWQFPAQKAILAGIFSAFIVNGRM